MAVPQGFKNNPANGYQTKPASTADPTLAPAESCQEVPPGSTAAPGATGSYPVEGITYGTGGYSADEPGNDGAY